MKIQLKWIAVILFALIFVACGSDGEMAHDGMEMDNDEMMGEVDESLEKMTNNGAFVVELRPMQDPTPLNEILTYELHIQDGDGNPVEGATVEIGGGMPDHGHGFPTEPSVAATDEAGVYLVEGVKYQMSGFWEMSFDISADATADSVTFNIILP